MLVEMAVLILIGVATFLFVLAPLIRPAFDRSEAEERPESRTDDGQQPVSDTP
jgi:hypothetical protein